MRPPVSRACVVSVVLAVALVLVASFPAGAGGEARRRGSCSGGPGHWELRVRREDPTTLRVRFKIEDVAPGQAWQLFLSDNGVRIYSGTKTSNAQGEVRVRRFTRNRSGTDRIAASGVNTKTGTTCEGRLSY
jgi:hypothetical protein